MSDLPIAARGKLMGARVKRVEDPKYLTGDARYIADIRLVGESHCVFVRSSVAHAWLRSVDTAKARDMPGVVGVFTAADLETTPLVDLISMPGTLWHTPQPALAVDRVRFVGEAIAVVVADDRARAEDAAEAVTATYDVLEALVDVERALAPDAPTLFDHLESNVVYRDIGEVGDVAGAFGGADHVFERRFHTNRFVASPMETRGVIADYDRSIGQLNVWSSTQSASGLRASLATALTHPAHRIRVMVPNVGGGFGQKLPCYPEEVVVAALARRLARPVKWIEDRRENLLAATHAKEQLIDIAAAVDADGTIRGLRARYVADGGAFSFNLVGVITEVHEPRGLMPNVYAITACAYESVGVLTNKSPIGPYRGIGWTAGHTARELLFDDIARSLGLTPEELRRRNILHDSVFPYQSPMGPVYDSGSYRESLETVLKRIDADGVRRGQAAGPKNGRYLGFAASPWIEPTGGGTEGAVQNKLPISSNDSGRVVMDPSGKVRATSALLSQGQGHATSFAQVVAGTLGIPIEDVAVSGGDTDADPFGLGTFISRGAVVASGIFGLAAADVRRKLLAVASRMLEVAPEDLRIEDGTISVAGSPDVTVEVSEVAGAAYFAPGLRDEAQADLASERFYDARASYSNGCLAVVVEVDARTGEVEILRIAAVEDCGTVINPLIVEGQVRGAIAQGIGGALFEAILYDDDGQLASTTLNDYILPTALDVPHITVDHLESPSPFTYGGVKGMGESGLVATPAAVIGAITDALVPFNARFDRLPLTPERILAAIGAIGGG